MVRIYRIQFMITGFVWSMIVASIVCVTVMLRTKCRSDIVVMMRAASKQNMRTEGDKRDAMDEASKHVTVTL